MKQFALAATLILIVTVAAEESCAATLAITPFHTANRSPLVQVFGLPEPCSSGILAPGKGEAALYLDIANNYTFHRTARETLLLDGEEYRTTLALRYGLGRKVEAAVEFPVVGNSGGTFDSFITGWHDFFNLPARDSHDSPQNRLDYRYTKNGSQRLRLDDSSFGIGDMRLGAGYQLYQGDGALPRSVALRVNLKLPTGNSDRLQGSGSVDTSLWLDASADYAVSTGHTTLFGSAGGMAMTRGDVLPDQQRSLAAFGTIGAGWAPTGWIAFILQVSGHTPFYKGSDLRELSSNALLLNIGGTLSLPGSFLLDIAVSEDIVVNSAPDVTLHLALRRSF